MGDIVNLRSVRKAKARATKVVEAQANRAKFGRTKGEKLREAREKERLAGTLDGAKRDEP